MPFTFSHPALVLPLTKINKKYISATALVAGSVSPDFEYFINMRLMQVHGHSFWGMFYYDLPIAIALCFLFHYTVRDALIKYSPFPVKDELKQYYGFNWKERFKTSWFVIAISALIGIGSHILWDDFTHANRFFVDLIPYLQRPVHFAGKTYLMCEIFWILSSLFGAAIVIICAYVPPLNKERKQKTSEQQYILGTGCHYLHDHSCVERCAWNEHICSHFNCRWLNRNDAGSGFHEMAEN